MTPKEREAYKTHETRISTNTSTYDEICIRCKSTDGIGHWGGLIEPCRAETAEHKEKRVVLKK